MNTNNTSPVSVPQILQLQHNLPWQDLITCC